MKFYWDCWDWNGKWMNRWMKIDDVWYELYVIVGIVFSGKKTSVLINRMCIILGSGLTIDILTLLVIGIK